MYICNFDERKAWVRFAAAAMEIQKADFFQSVHGTVRDDYLVCKTACDAGILADAMLEEYRKRVSLKVEKT